MNCQLHILWNGVNIQSQNRFWGDSLAVSIKDVAKAAGVSVGTVSRAFNDYNDIRFETKELILETAKQLGYVPNLNAKILSGKSCQTMAIILAGFMADRGLTDELVIKMLRGACRYAISHNVEFAVYILSSEQQKEKSYEQFCGEHSLSGSMCFGLKTTDAYYENLQNSRIPCVTVDVPVEGENMGYVGTDDVSAMEEMTELLLQMNHRRIVFLNGRRHATVCENRLKGIENVLHAKGLELEGNFYTDFNAEQSEALVMEYIQKHKTQGATAFLCASDLIALGACKAITRCGYKVGEDFSVTGFDGVHMASLCEPPLTTINQNMEEKGYAAAEMLQAIVNHRDADRKELVPYTLIKTKSVGYNK